MALRIATYNVAWFNALFDDDGGLLADDQPSSRHAITRAAQIAALGLVFRAMDADGVMVIEAPDTGSRRSTITALERFAAQFGLRARRAVMGFASETEQEIAFLFDPDRLTPRHDPQASDTTPRFDGSYTYDRDTAPHLIRFSKPPLELTVAASGKTLRLIGVHAKSKAPHGARNCGRCCPHFHGKPTQATGAMPVAARPGGRASGGGPQPDRAGRFQRRSGD